MAGQYRNWCWTLNNPEGILDPAGWPNCKAAIWQLEQAESGTVHFQGYVEMTQGTRLANMRQLDGLETAHFERRMGSRDQAIAYCRKQDATYLEGPWFWPSEDALAVSRQQGRRTDLENVTQMVIAGATNEEIIDVSPVVYVKFNSGLERLRTNMRHTHRDANVRTTVILYVGPTRTGKSYRLSQECPPGPDWYWCSAGKWFDGYQGQAGLVFDEFRDSWMPFEMLLKIIDNKPLQVETKGSHVELMAYHFRFSSNVHPKKWYRKVKLQRNWETSPLRARMKRIILMTERVPEEFDEPVVDEAADWSGADSSEEAPLAQGNNGVLWAPNG